MGEAITKLAIEVVTYGSHKSAIQQVRYQVFQCEQQVSAEMEFDGKDETATHLLAMWDEVPGGTTRMRELGDRIAKIERVAVLSHYRGLGIGRRLMEVAIAHLRAQGMAEIKINAQTQAQSFYTKLGFQQRGEEFEEAGIPHVAMRLTLL
jgi:predicted GNAT family N-acyltransferase